MKEFIALVIIFWVPPFFAILRNILWDVYFWQIKEFRWDRFWVHLRWDQEELNREPLATGLKFISFAFVSLVFVHPLSAIIGIILAFLTWTNELYIFLSHLLNGKLKRPSLKNPRSIIILGLFLVTLFSVIAYITLPFSVFEDRTDDVRYVYFADIIDNKDIQNIEIIFPDVYLLLSISTLTALFIDLASPFIITLFVGITFPIARIRRKFLIFKARNHLKQLGNKLVVIGITGSQGKTTTKEILYNLLKNHYNVAKTPANQNTDVGVAQAILKHLKEDTQIFIVEMGALRKNEIKDICRLIPPDIAIVTDVDVQHMGIFGSQVKLFEAKSEIVRFKKAEGTAILNGDNHFCRKMSELHGGENIIYVSSSKDYEALVKEKKPENQIVFFKNNHPEKGLSFRIKTNNFEEDIEVNIDGDHLTQVFVSCIMAASELNIGINEIKRTLKEFSMKLPRLSIEPGDNGTTILNDTYNSSFKGFIAAVNLMNKNKKGKKIVITKGIYELGRYKYETYKRLLKEASNKIDVLITSDSLLAKAAKEDNNRMEICLLKKNVDIVYKLRQIMNEGDTVLLEGRLHPSIIKEVVSDNN